MKLYDHQKRIIEADPKKCPLAWGTGGGKTRTLLELCQGATLVIVPKQQKLDRTWENNCTTFGIVANIHVVSKEEFRRDWQKLERFNTVICDEAHHMLGVLPETRQRKGLQVPKTSQMFEALMNYLAKHNPERFYLASATPISKPMNLWAMGKLLGKNWDFHKFRSAFYIEKKMGYRTIWLPKRDNASKERLIRIFKEKLGAYTGQLSDWFDVPEMTFVTKHFSLTKEQKEALSELKSSDADPMVIRTKSRSIENGILYTQDVEIIDEKSARMKRGTRIFPCEKMEYILEKAEEFPKMIIFANYTAQVNEIAKRLSESGYNVRTLTGQTKDRARVVSEVEKTDEIILVAQASVSSGWEVPSCRVTIFASLSYKVLDKIQAKGRTLRANNIQKNLYIDLVMRGGVDEQCFKSIDSGVDFNEMIYDEN